MLLALALVLLLATGLAACGGDDSSDPTTGSAPATTQQTAPTTTTEDDGSSQKEKEPGDDRGGSTGGSDDSGSETEDSGSGSGSEDSDSDSGSRDSSNGSGSEEEGASSFRTPGGDNSIQDFGEEADAEERAAASAVVVGFMRARANRDWAAVCGYIASATLKPVEQVASRSPQFKGKDCVGILEILTGATPDSTRANTLGGSIDSLRVKGDRGFALYHGTDGKDYFIPLVKEDGEWKVGALAPSPF